MTTEISRDVDGVRDGRGGTKWRDIGHELVVDGCGAMIHVVLVHGVFLWSWSCCSVARRAVSCAVMRRRCGDADGGGDGGFSLPRVTGQRRQRRRYGVCYACRIIWLRKSVYSCVGVLLSLSARKKVKAFHGIQWISDAGTALWAKSVYLSHVRRPNCHSYDEITGFDCRVWDMPKYGWRLGHSA